MSHYEIDYTKLPDGERQKKAMDDIVAYIGKDKVVQISAAVRSEPIPRKSFIIQLSLFVGIEGYPAEVWADQLDLK